MLTTNLEAPTKIRRALAKKVRADNMCFDIEVNSNQYHMLEHIIWEAIQKKEEQIKAMKNDSADYASTLEGFYEKECGDLKDIYVKMREDRQFHLEVYADFIEESFNTQNFEEDPSKKYIETTTYRACHKPEFQHQIDGVCIDPILRPEFDFTGHDERPSDEYNDWWGRAFIRSGITGEGIVEYEIRCLDGGAWDRSTWKGQTPYLDEAVNWCKGISTHVEEVA